MAGFNLNLSMKIISRRLLDRILFTYSIIAALILTWGALENISIKSNLVTLLLFLPVLLYLFADAFFSFQKTLTTALNIDLPKHHRYFGAFSFSSFFYQSRYDFLVTLLLFTLALTLCLVKLSLNLIQ